MHQYFVLWPDGTRFGPADVSTLQRWAVENRIGPATILEEMGSRRQVRAMDVPDLRSVLPFQMNMPPGGFVPANPTSGAGTETKIAWFLGVIGLLCMGSLPAVGGIILAAMGMQKRQQGAQAALIFNVVVLVVGFVFGAILRSLFRAF